MVVHHRGREHLLESLDAIAATSRGLAAETILVDNTAGQPMEEVLRRHPTLRRVVAGRNVGFASGCRLGCEAARAPLVAFVNDDAVVLPGALEGLAAALTRAPSDVVAAARSWPTVAAPLAAWCREARVDPGRLPLPRQEPRPLWRRLRKKVIGGR